MFRSLLAGLFVLVGLSVARGADVPLNLPSEPGYWINSPPLSLEALQGKGVVLYYFEEQCPSCMKRWPELAALSSKYAGKPVIFMGVSSGTQRNEMEKYVRTNGVSWPVVLDPNREIEKLSNLPKEISLENIMQCRYVTADGKLHNGDFRDMPGMVDKALVGAAWRVDPTGLPTSLQAPWKAIEMGNFPLAATALKKGLADKNTEIKAGAEKLQAAIAETMTKEVAAAEKKASAQDKWTTYKEFRTIAMRYKGMELPVSFKKQGSSLQSDPDVKGQLAALQQFELLQKGVLSGSPVARKRNLEKLNKLISDNPTYEAAALATEFKEKAGLQQQPK